MKKLWPISLRRKRWWSLLLLLPALPVFWVALTTWLYSSRSSDRASDAAIVLGAAVWKDKPSPVFRERINHAIRLYRDQLVGKIIFTGGKAEGDTLSEAEAARAYALEQGVPPGDILLETSSTKTYDNLRFAREIARQEGLQSFLIVSDPLHMRRALTMASDLGLDALPSPTPTTRYQTRTSQASFLAREVYYSLGYSLGRLAGNP